ncbi:MAG: site-specific DNA-methyltransferase [Deltaproteobacteria bacterium]|nr:site-specific DNA-methyltransferase [Deltaproteobacteria bacterium]
MMIKRTQIQHKPFFTNQDDTFVLFHADSLDVLARLPQGSVNLIFADPPYFLSNGGMTCQSGKRANVDKGQWDRARSPEDIHEFNMEWLSLCQRALHPNGTMFVTGTRHVIFSVGFAMQQLGFKLLNDISWYKVTPPPNLSCRYFTHSTETIIWAARNQKSKHFFDYQSMKLDNAGKQMRSLWSIMPPRKAEKRFGKHPTQKPIALLDRIIRAASQPGDLILDPFNGSGTTGIAAALLDRRYIGSDLDPQYLRLTVKRFLDLEGEPDLEVLRERVQQREAKAKIAKARVVA